MTFLQNYLRLMKLFTNNRSMYRVIQSVRQNRLTYLSRHALVDLYEAAHQVEVRRLPGEIIEAGVALGGSTIVLALAKSIDRSFFVYDAFGIIPPPSSDDGPDAHARYAQIAGGQAHGIRGDRYYGYEDALLEKVLSNFANFGVDPERHHLHVRPGLFEETLVVDQPVALAHIDCDWYDSVMICLEQITPHLVSGGVMIIDDYKDWSGCKRAVDEYFATCKGEFTFTMKSKLHIERSLS